MIIKPTEKQLRFLDWEFGAFFHFGIRSFFPGHTDWDEKPMPASAFNPTHLDCKQWIRTAKAMGATYAIFTCKHHDGFANWPSKYSDYSVAQTQWENGKGDVVRTFVDACRTYKMKVGLYYSPAQWGGTVKFTEDKEYDDYFINQITELLTNYGKIDYLWFDGCGSENHEYDKVRIIRTIRTLQPDILIFAMWDPDTRWVGNEDGYAEMPNVNTVSSARISVNDDVGVSVDGLRYLPAECDMQMRSTWFDCEANEDTIKSVEELVGIYEYSVGRGANLLLNFGPDSRGLVPEADVRRAVELGEELRRRYGNALHFTDAAKDGDKWSIYSEDNTLVDTVVIEEDIREGEVIEEFRVLANMPRYNRPICVYCGKTVGHRAICRFPAMMTRGITVEILKTTDDAPAVLRSVKAYHVSK